ncbi:MAG TPA: S41 family peptidase [Candidatus Babeliales bacterium]|nr:S41 family peptidase [Candidatus Babeliales bacterium]
MNKLTTITLFSFFALRSFACSNHDALKDLEHMRTMLLNNHPGVYNDQDPDFVTHLNKNFDESSHKIKESSDSEEHNSILTYFAKSFNDSHLCVSFNQSPTNTNPAPHKKRKPFYSVGLQNDVQWIALPTFMPNEDEQKTLKDIIANLATLRSHKLIIFDVHGNSGGNSFWAKSIVENLFGESYATEMINLAEKDISVEWRASKDNIDYLKKLYLSFEKQYGMDSEPTQWLTKIINDLQQAHNQDLPLCTSNENAKSTISSNNNVNPVLAKIVIVTDKCCGSACLDFIDYVKAMKHDVTLFGQTTGTDTVYMEVHTTDLPSKKGTFSFPIKVYRNRPRGNNVPYNADISYDGDMNDTIALQQAVIKHFC